MPSGSFGRTGFAGTSIWADPGSGLVSVLLTNATHLDVPQGSGALRALRPRFHNVLLALVSASR